MGITHPKVREDVTQGKSGQGIMRRVVTRKWQKGGAKPGLDGACEREKGPRGSHKPGPSPGRSQKLEQGIWVLAQKQ